MRNQNTEGVAETVVVFVLILMVAYNVLQAEDEGVALTVAAYLDEETHIPPPRSVLLLCYAYLLSVAECCLRFESIDVSVFLS